MKKIVILLLSLICLGNINAQTLKNCHPQTLIVAAENLNFRAAPETKGKVIDQLDNGEVMTFLEIPQSEIERHRFINGLSYVWIKVQRNRTGEEGYVFGKYLKAANMAYQKYNDGDRIQKGNWYGIFKGKKSLQLEKINPKLGEMDGFSHMSTGEEKYQFLICSQKGLSEGAISGRLFDYESNSDIIKIGTRRQIYSTTDRSFELVCTGEVKYDPPWMAREKERVLFITEVRDGANRKYIQQDLTDCLLQYGEVGYYLHFVGDLNGDNIPELILSEGDTKMGVTYYFVSNAAGELELESRTVVSSKC